MLILAEIAKDEEHAQQMLLFAIESGQALAKLAALIDAQGGDSLVTKDTSLLPKARIFERVKAQKDGYLSAVNCRGLGEAAGLLGAGRIRKDDIVDPAVGFIVKKRIGDPVMTGETLIELHANDELRLKKAFHHIEKCLTIEQNAEKPTLIYNTVC